MPVIFLAPLAFIGLVAIGVIASAIKGGRRARNPHRYAVTDPNRLLPLQSELLPSALPQAEFNSPERHAPGHHHHHHPDPASGTGSWSADPGNPGGAPQHHHHG